MFSCNERCSFFLFNQSLGASRNLLESGKEADLILQLLIFQSFIHRKRLPSTSGSIGEVPGAVS